MRRSASTSSRTSWHGPWRPPWPSIASLTCWSSARTARSCACRRARGTHPPPALPRPQQGPARGADRRRRGRRDVGPRPADRPAVRERRGRHGRPRGSRRPGEGAAPGTPRRPSSSSPTDMAPAPTRSACGRPTSSTSRSVRAAGWPIGPPQPPAGARYEEVDGALAVDLDTPDDLVYVELHSTEGVDAG